MGAPRVVIVDTDHQVSNNLRTSLQQSGQPFTIIDTPSGEEAMLESSRGGIDLIVTDLWLPGISGLELLERMRNQNPDVRSIIVTAKPTDEARERAEELGVVAFLAKPIRTSHFLEAVTRALELKGGEPQDEERAFVAEWLMVMQRELGAEATYLLNGSGEVIVEAGELDAVDLKSAVPELMSAFEAGVKISSLLETEVPANFMFFDGERYDVYLASAGSEHALVIVFESKKGAKQIGAVLQYSRQAANDLVSGLYSLGEGEMATNPPEKKDEEPSDPNNVNEDDLESAAEALGDQDPEKFWEDATGKLGETGPIGDSTLTWDEAQKRGLLSEESSD